MTIQYKETMTLIIIFALISLIIPICMMTSSRNTIVQSSVNHLANARHENQLVINRALKMPYSDQAKQDLKQWAMKKDSGHSK